ncbi:hypothetical protein ABB37_09490 [Leptomonas pyrrhocoris]|uniref:BAR domain-containing protein n=1 Tax=Leptomonas pyrrhocoris TaxID=157538 RepID=A0A0M9FQD2_LEPPY|nr:hypothetical protein ABB37_09490 [Leptomonas pyrrhocoris]XP_015652296.1 hypothetical protein ABB37_09490 [Leptomonas pyrrhocoris]XP_015652297.1 hypothetical protein ABB37_09490 [Leptomonas pyrrhocoris]KPA73856.1 hypothetical protein ABB37_09490 [Leptomonas pyrrhocoris]KPA73857.1 hypothetical protein ABB37_09490 [Leptomonas pyrrhocoris]KPA73858.1 hypothetical protein ABB37_09490 [Leptomonas pyrrhocoris]|eukprot:XP_015652295.1 hypothetical protein ABB37_09490 [Leptomonas pyrrhocoris]
MPKAFLDAAQRQRSDQLHSTHRALSAVEEAARKAVKQHDKYMRTMESVVSAILDNSDRMEETRMLFGPQGEEVIAPTFEVTGRFADAFVAWKSSAEVQKMREDLDALGYLSGMAKRSVKLAEKSSSDLEKAAQNAAQVRKKAKDVAVGRTLTSRENRRAAKRTEVEAQVQVMNDAVVESMLSIAKWWSSKLVAVTNGIYSSYADIGAATTALFPPPSPAVRPVSAGEHAPLGTPPPPPQPPALPPSELRQDPSLNHLTAVHADPTVPAAHSIPPSSVSARHPQTTTTNSSVSNTRTATAVTANAETLTRNAASSPSLLTSAEHRDDAGGPMQGRASEAVTVVPPPTAGVPLVFRTR